MVIRPSLVRPPCALKNVIVGVAARPLLSTVRPGIALSTAPYARVVGRVSRTPALITVSRRVFWTSTTGDSPLTVTVSSRAPTFISADTLAVADPASSIPSRLTVLKPVSVNVTV
jgi:hypothetical protein